MKPHETERRPFTDDIWREPPPLSVGRELAALHLGLSLRQARLFLRRQRKDRLLVAGIGQQHAGCLTLGKEAKTGFCSAPIICTAQAVENHGRVA